MDPTNEPQHDAQNNHKTNYRQYKRNWDKNRRASVNPAERAQHSDQQNMGFFVKILKSLKINYKQFSELTGVSQQLVSWWLSTDDCKYSNIINAFDKLGIDISCHYEPMPDSRYVINEDTFLIQIDSLPQLNTKSETEQCVVLDDVLENDGNLKFLAELIVGLRMDIRSFAQEIDSNYHVVYTWLKKDDIKISKIYKIGNTLQQRVAWTIKKKEQ